MWRELRDGVLGAERWVMVRQSDGRDGVMVAAGSLDENEEALVDCKEAHKRGGSRWQAPGE